VELIIKGLEPWAAPTHYFNFGEAPADASRFYSAETYERLREVRRRIDPDGLIAGKHPIAG
jgi:hypothetical protein